MATAYPVYSPASAPGLAQFLDADTCKVGILQTVGDAYVGGKLGVGTLTPATLGHFASGATGGTILTLEQAYGDADAPDLTIKKARGTLAAPTVITTADDLGMISFAGYSGAGGYVTGAAIKGTSEGTIATTRVPGRLTFWTGTDAAPTVLTERMRIDSAGYIAIGTTSAGTHDLLLYKNPASPRDVGIWVTNANTSGGNYASVGVGQADTGGVYGYFIWTSSGSGSTNYLSASSTALVGTAVGGLNLAASHASGNITFYTGSGDNANRRMIIDSTGKVGIGTLTPEAPLSVVGTTTLYGSTSANTRKITLIPTEAGVQTICSNWSGSGTDSQLILGCYTYRANQLVLDTTGFVGVGTTSPQYIFHIAKNASHSEFLVGDKIENDVADGVVRCWIGNSAASAQLKLGQSATNNLVIEWTYNATPANAFAEISTNGTGGNPLILQNWAGGKVGIGLTAPGVLLDVGGSIRSYTTTASIFTAYSTGAIGAGRAILQLVRNSGTEYGWDLATNVAFNTDNFTIREIGGSGDTLARVTIEKTTGRIGFGVASPTAVLHLKDGSATAGTAPLKFTSGALLTTPEAGAIEFLSDKFYGTITTGTVRSAFVFETRSISTGTGLSGGGDLSANRTLTLDQAVSPTWTGYHKWKTHSAFTGSEFAIETGAVQTTDDTVTPIWTKALADNSVYWVEVHIVGRTDSTGANRAYYARTFYVYRQTTSTLGNIIYLVTEESDPDWDVTVTLATNTLQVNVVGKDSVTINWAGTVKMQAVSGNA